MGSKLSASTEDSKVEWELSIPTREGGRLWWLKRKPGSFPYTLSGWVIVKRHRNYYTSLYVCLWRVAGIHTIIYLTKNKGFFVSISKEMSFLQLKCDKNYIVILFAATGLTDNCTTSTFVHNNRLFSSLQKFSCSININNITSTCSIQYHKHCWI